MKSWALRIAIAAVVLLLLSVLIVVLRPPPPPAPLPSPNGYDDFVQAATAVPGDIAFADYLQWRADELARQVAAQSNVFVMVKAGLGKECRVPPIPSSAASDLEARMARLASFKRLAQVLAAHSHLALIEGRTNDAIEASLDGVQVAHGIARGGVMIEALVGFANENIALRTVSGAAVSELDATTARIAARRLTELDARAPTSAETMACERAYARSHGFYGVIMSAADRFDFGPLVSGRKNFQGKWTAQAARRRELILQLARRAFEVEQGRRPSSDAELVPTVLTALPEIPRPSNSVPGEKP
jgi:hypothetical protein